MKRVHDLFMKKNIEKNNGADVITAHHTPDDASIIIGEDEGDNYTRTSHLRQDGFQNEYVRWKYHQVQIAIFF